MTTFEYIQKIPVYSNFFNFFLLTDLYIYQFNWIFKVIYIL